MKKDPIKYAFILGVVSFFVSGFMSVLLTKVLSNFLFLGFFVIGIGYMLVLQLRKD